MDLVERLRSPEPLIAVELRPPRIDLSEASSMDSWFDMHRTVRRLVSKDTVLFLTDRAVGSKEEENLQHLISNLEDDVPKRRICPFLTAKHSLEYCLWYSLRAAEAGYPGLVVLGGDEAVGPPRCVPHSYVLRQKIRDRSRNLALGGWANPHREPAKQVDFLLAPDFTAEFYLTQIVSHYEMQPIERFTAEASRRGVPHPGLFGIFYYRSANARTLERLSRFIRVPARELTRDFQERGLSADEICARTIASLRRVGANKVYISNLPTEEAADRLAAISAMVGS